jgi:histidine triad (HIT) family protein
MEVCPFCAIVQKKSPAQIVYEDEYAVAFRDIRPQAPVHILIVPKLHVESADAVADLALWIRLMAAVKAVVGKLGLTGGYRLVVNCGESAGQTVPHLHIHLLSGRGLHWPPG